VAKARNPLPAALIEEFLRLDDNGILIWKKSPHPRIKAGDRAGRVPKGKHLQVTINKKAYSYHRIVYYLAYGIDSLGWEIDHINRDPTDNRPENLRLASESDNKWNTQRRNKTNVGHRGIRKRFWGQSYRWEVTFRGSYVGSFSSMEEAVDAWESRAKDHAGAFFCPPQNRE